MHGPRQPPPSLSLGSLGDFGTLTMKRRFLLLLFASLLCIALGRAEDTATEPQVTLTDFKDGITGFRYIWRIPHSALSKLPVWSPSDSEPPLSPHKAVATATRYLEAILPSSTKVSIYAIALEKQGIGADQDPKQLSALWAYHISFNAVPEPPPKFKAQLEVLITLDGTLIKPIVSPLK